MSSTTPIDKKRRWTTDPSEAATPNEALVVSRPPLKKRFTANGTIAVNNVPSQSSTAANTNTSTQPPTTADLAAANSQEPDSFIAEHQQLSRDALMKQMRKAKDEHATIEQAIASVEANGDELAARRNMIRLQWTMVLNDLSLMGKALDTKHIPRIELPRRSESDPRAISESLHGVQLPTQSTAKDIVELVQNWLSRSDQAHEEYKRKNDHSEKQQVLMDWVRREVADLVASYDKSQVLVQEMDQQHRSIVDLATTAAREIRSAEDQLKNTQSMLDESMDKLAHIEKRQDRSESAAVSAFLNAHPGAQSTMQRETSASASPAPTNQTVEPAKKPVVEESDEQTAKEYQLIVDARTRELDDLQRERQQLIEQAERLRGKFLVLTDEQLMATEYFKVLQLSLDHYKSRSHYLEEVKSHLQIDLDDVSSERRKIADEIKAEKVSQGMTMEGEMRRLENDLARIRKQRDDFQLMVDAQSNKKKKEKELHEAILAEIDKEAERMLELERRLSELRSTTESSNEGLYADLAASYGEIHAKISDARTVLKFVNEKHQGQLASDPAMIQKHKDTFSAWDKAASTHQDLTALMAKIDNKVDEHDKINLMIQFLADNEAQLMTQIDRAGAIFAKLEEQNSKSVFGLTQKQEQKSKLQAEKAKFAHTFGSLKVAKDKQIANVAALRRTSDQQLDHIRQLEERERSLESQVTEKENQVRQIGQSLEERRINVEDLQQQCNEIRISLEHSDTSLHELQKIVRDKTRALDEEKQLRKRVDEEFEKMQRKWIAVSQSDSGMQEQLAQECDELRGLLKCSACRTRFRKRLLSRCMHTFCPECIDARLETRQRRCPTCGESFGVNDVRPFIL